MRPFFLLSLASAGFPGCVFERNQNAAPPVSLFAEEIKMELPRKEKMPLVNKSVYDEELMQSAKYPRPLFYTQDYSIFVERPWPTAIEVYPHDAASECEAVFSRVKSFFNEYP